MTTTNSPDQGENAGPVDGIAVEPVTRWLENNIEGAVGPFDFELITGGHSNLTYRVTGRGGADLVLRRPPLAAVLATAHDMAREHRVISAVAKTSVPVPTALGLCTDDSINGAPFYVMDYVEGVVLHDEETVRESIPDPEVRANVSVSAVTALAELHVADRDAIGLGDLGRTEGYVDRQLKRWQGQWDKTKTRELPAMDKAYQLLIATKPEQRYTSVVHGDFRLGNMLVDPASGRVLAVLDWELCTLGDPLADFGYLLNNWLEPGEPNYRGATDFPTQAGGFLTKDEITSIYCERTGFDPDHLAAHSDYYRAFQLWRLAAIVEGVYSRYLKGALGELTEDIDEYADQVTNLAESALELLTGG
ncbi:MAG: phosphotransferase family protein [Acidimicrobiia bacterium]|nr:phosphotransferase family protein [Acidimicrobiia bacterium]